MMRREKRSVGRPWQRQRGGEEGKSWETPNRAEFGKLSPLSANKKNLWEGLLQATVSFLAKRKVCYGKNKTSRVSSVDIRTEDQIANIRQHVADILVLATGSKSMPMARISNIEL